jgi:hypothetical protein
MGSKKADLEKVEGGNGRRGERRERVWFGIRTGLGSGVLAREKCERSCGNSDGLK